MDAGDGNDPTGGTSTDGGANFVFELSVGGWPAEDRDRPTSPAYVCALGAGSQASYAGDGAEQQMLIDSGASLSACPRGFFDAVLDATGPLEPFRAANGDKVQRYGRQAVDLEAGGVPFNMVFEVADVKKPIIAVSDLIGQGFVLHFARGGAFLEKAGRQLRLGTDGGQFFLRARRQSFAELAPLSAAFVEAAGDVEQLPETEDRKRLDAPMPLELRAPFVRKGPRDPSEQEQREHEAAHLPFRSWCGVCVAARAREHPHFRSEVGGSGEHRVEIDFLFLTARSDGKGGAIKDGARDGASSRTQLGGEAGPSSSAGATDFAGERGAA